MCPGGQPARRFSLPQAAAMVEPAPGDARSANPWWTPDKPQPHHHHHSSCAPTTISSASESNYNASSHRGRGGSRRTARAAIA